MNNPCNYQDKQGLSASVARQWIDNANWMTQVDGPYPFADIIFWLGVVVCGAVDIITLTSHKSKASEYIETRTYAKSISKDREQYDTHHIVAQKAADAEPAREVLRSVDIDPFYDGQNLVILPRNAHKFIHTKSYYAYVNRRLEGLKGNREMVEITLACLRIEILIYVELGWKAW